MRFKRLALKSFPSRGHLSPSGPRKEAKEVQHAVSACGGEIPLFHSRHAERSASSLEPGTLMKITGKWRGALRVLAFDDRNKKGWVHSSLKKLGPEMTLPDSHRKILRLKEYRDTPFLGPVLLSQAKQGSLGDCYLVSSLMAIALRDPVFIKTMIHTMKESGQYRVRLFDPKSKEERFYLVNSLLPTLHGKLIYGHSEPIIGTDRQALWLPIIEKAYAQMKGSYRNLNKGGFCLDAFQALTGRKAFRGQFCPTIPSMNRVILKSISRAQELNKPMTLESLAYPRHSLVEGSHAYTLYSFKDHVLTIIDPRKPLEKIQVLEDKVAESFAAAVISHWPATQ